MIRVLMCLPNLRVSNGVASFAMNYFRNLNHDEVQMDFAIYSDISSPYYEEIRKQGRKIYVLPSIKRIDLHIKCCLDILNQGQYDVIHNNTLIITLPMMWCAVLKRVPVRILHSHSAKVGFTKLKQIRNQFFIPLLKMTATNFVACSDVAGKGMFGKHKYEILPNVIDSSKYVYDENKRASVRKEMGVEGCFVVGSVGRVSVEKNPFFAMDVFKLVAEKEPTARYWWIGSGPLNEQLATYVKKLGIEDRVILFGSRNNVIDLYQAMDCFFLPSLFEGLPVTGLEAQAMGLPCLISDTVTREVGYTPCAYFISLRSSCSELAEVILQQKNNRRKGYSNELTASMFSATNASDLLSFLYQKYID